tara:strand:+ start:525 stop:767 length:243 start_codon:yes stop_codon:yes gene_type:complete
MNSKILFFSAPWCGPCKGMKKVLNESILKDLNIEIIDITEEVDLASKYMIMNVPTFIKLENNNEVSRKSGSVTIEQLKNL